MRGVTLVELLVATLLVFLIAGSMATIVSTQNRASLWVRDESEGMETVRTVRVVLGAELRHGLEGRDWWATGGDTVTVRAFRGMAEVCSLGAEPTEFVVLYRGIRQPNPDKDSVLVLSQEGRWETRGLERIEMQEGGCPGVHEESQKWTLDRAVGRAVFVRIFERGSYHLADGAFRYRSGLGGRQPLTPQHIDDARSHLGASEGGVDVVVELERRSDARWRPDPVPDHWRIWPAERP